MILPVGVAGIRVHQPVADAAAGVIGDAIVRDIVLSIRRLADADIGIGHVVLPAGVASARFRQLIGNGEPGPLTRQLSAIYVSFARA